MTLYLNHPMLWYNPSISCHTMCFIGLVVDYGEEKRVLRLRYLSHPVIKWFDVIEGSITAVYPKPFPSRSA